MVAGPGRIATTRGRHGLAVLTACAVLCIASPAAAEDTWSAPFPGVRRLARTTATPWRIQAVVVDLCAPGVSLRATRSSERGQVVSSFGQAVDAEIAVNGDFFGAGYSTSGLAIGAAETWGNDGGGQGFIAFGAHQSWVSEPSAVVSPPPPWMEEAVGGRPLIVAGGAVVANTSSLCTVRHPRTAAGLSRDGQTLILAVVDGRSSRSVGMTCNELGALMMELGADRAINLDGGGSSTLWQRGVGVLNAPSDGSQRVVANHLAVRAKGSGQPPQCPIPRQEVLHMAPGAHGGGQSDVDGDGVQDMCARGADGVTCALSRNGILSEVIGGPELSDESGWNDASNYATLRLGDIDGNGLADVCARANAGFLCWPSQGDQFGEAVQGPDLSDDDGWNQLAAFATLQLADVDGDGMDDVCGRSSDGFRCHLATGAGFESEPVLGPLGDDGWQRLSQYGTLRMGDVDGDGRDDLCGRQDSGVRCWLSDGAGFPTEIEGPAWSDDAGWGWVDNWSTIRLADVTGDGRADLCARSNTEFRCHPSLGDSFGEPILGPDLADEKGWADPHNFTTLRMGDLDGDRKLDLCARADRGIVCWLAKGAGFGEGIAGPALSDDDGWNHSRFHRTIRLVDIDGNGGADLCARSSVGVLCWPFADGAFAAEAVPGPGWGDDDWGQAPYYTTIRAAGVTYPDDPCSDGTCEPDEPGDRDGDAAGDDLVGGCATSSGGGAGGGILVLALWLTGAGRRRVRGLGRLAPSRRVVAAVALGVEGQVDDRAGVGL